MPSTAKRHVPSRVLLCVWGCSHHREGLSRYRLSRKPQQRPEFQPSHQEYQPYLQIHLGVNSKPFEMSAVFVVFLVFFFFFL